MVEKRVAQGRSSFVPATMELVVGVRTVEVDLSRGVRAMVEYAVIQILNDQRLCRETTIVLGCRYELLHYSKNQCGYRTLDDV